jgi:hypothetical protein
MQCSSVLDRMWRVDVQVSLAMLSVAHTVLAPNDDRTTAKNTFKMARKQVEGT